MLTSALEHLVKGIVDHPDEVKVVSASSARGEVLEVHVHPEDLGRVIGRAGRTAKALRTIVKMRKQEPTEREEQEAILETYLHALGMLKN